MSHFVVEVDPAASLRRALVVTAFPTLGNVSTVAARFLVEVADLKCIGSIYSPRLPPFAAVHDGWPVGPVEVFAGERVCGVDGVCESLVVVTSNVPIPNELAHDLAMAIIDWSRQIGAGEVVALEGMKSDRDSEESLLGIGSTPGAVEALRKLDIPVLEDGLLGGITGVLLHRGRAEKVMVYGLLVRANEHAADARAAATLVRTVDRLLIRAGFDDAAIESSVKRVEEKVRAKQHEAQEQTHPRPVDIAYR